MEYTKLWNSEFVKNTKNIKNLNLCLEIGCFEGLTSNYIVDNILNETGKLICVDPLENTYLSENLSEIDIKNNETTYNYFNNQYDRFICNVRKNIDYGKIELYRMLSSKAYEQLSLSYKDKFDLIYIDGDHRADGVYLDAINCFSLVKKNGFIIFDDYLWGDYNDKNSTKKGIDRFLNEFSGKYDIKINDYQIMIQKI